MSDVPLVVDENPLVVNFIMQENVGSLIWLEGPDGSGKTSLGRSIKSRLQADESYKDRNIILTRAPGGTKIGSELRELLVYDNGLTNLSRFYGFMMDMSQHIEELIIPSLERGSIVISDRSFYSTYVYQVLTSLVNRELFINNARVLTNKLHIFNSTLLLIDIDKTTQDNRLSSRVNQEESTHIFESTQDKISKFFSLYKDLIENVDLLNRELSYECIVKVIEGNKSISEVTSNIYDLVF